MGQDAVGQDVRRSLSPPSAVAAVDSLEHWNVDQWDENVEYAVESSPHSDRGLLRIHADSLVQGRYHRQVPLTPTSEYRLTFGIKTEGVQGPDAGARAGVRLGGFEFAPDTTLQGTTDWTRRSVTFRTQDHDSMVLEFLLGKEEPTRGTVWIDDITLERTARTPLDPAIKVDLDEKQSPMSEYIYGQFIEHMGQSIYGGIWAEMLEDRKFYFVPGTEYSPWHVNVPSRLVIDSLDAYVGDYAPVLRATADTTTRFFQDGLYLEGGQQYEGHVVLTGRDAAMPVNVILSWGDGPQQRDTVRIREGHRGYQSHSFTFEAGADIEDGRLSVVPRGEGVVEIGTISMMPADNVDGFRRDVLALLKELNAPVYRWPGGNFVSGYNWKDGVGPHDRRPPRLDQAWASEYEHRWDAIEHNDVGLHEFMRLCAILDTEPYIAINTGLGTAKLAAEKVEYLNGSMYTPMGQWRAEHGHPGPFDVQFFAVGNEMFGEWQLGYVPLDRYVKKHNRVARAMWDVDPTIDLVGVGRLGEWNQEMYAHSVDYMTYISEHFYRQDWHGGGLMRHVMQMPDAIGEIADAHREWAQKVDGPKGRDIKVILDEWNYWYGPHVYGLLGTRYFLRDALGIAAGINEYLRNSDIIYMANYAQTVNVIGAIKATPRGAFLSATGEILRTHRAEMGTVPVSVTGERLPFDIAAALTDAGGTLTISVVNPTEEARNLPVSVVGGEVAEKWRAHVITGAHDMVYNDLENKDRAGTTTRTVSMEDGALRVPAASATILQLDL
ncbi:MAG: alpha-L-arabinofuranosidase C-terminal domain-containing protein [Candidatus Bipolaricaulia bacterium]